MSTKELIEDIIIHELRGLCSNCSHFNACSFQRHATKEIIQCELYEVDHDKPAASFELKGLCKNCDHVNECVLPEKMLGVWRCSAYK